MDNNAYEALIILGSAYVLNLDKSKKSTKTDNSQNSDDN